MKISKFIHSCILLKEGGEQLLIDPGNYTFEEGLVKAADLREANTILITHNHADHFDPAAIRDILSQNTAARVYANSEMCGALHAAGIPAEVLESGKLVRGNFEIEAFETPHEPVLSPSPVNTAFVINKKFMHIGDSLSPKILEHPAQIVALPVAAPWLTDVGVREFAYRLKPERFVPVHDGYVKDLFSARKYGVWAKVFGEQGIKFEPLSKPGDSIEI